VLKALIVLTVSTLTAAVGRRQADRVGQRHLNSVTHKLDEEEPGWRMEDIEADRRTRTPPPEQNGALVVLAAAAKIPADWSVQWRGYALWQCTSPEPNLPPPEHIEQLKAAAARVTEARALAHTLRSHPTGHYPVTFPADRFSLVHRHLWDATNVTELLEFEAALAVTAEGDPDRAVRSAHSALNVARSIGDEPSIGAQLTRSSCRSRSARIVGQTLAWGTPTGGLAELQAALLADAEEPLLLNTMRGHRASMHQLFDGLEARRFEYREIYTSVGLKEPPLGKPAMFHAYRPLLPGDHAEALRRLTEGVAVAKLPPHEQLAAARALPNRLDRDDFRHSLTNRFVPSVRSIATTMLISRAELVTAAVGIAAERFRLANGRWPESLAEIPLSIIPVLPVSPFDGTPLRYRSWHDRVVIYCHLADETLRWSEPPEFKNSDVPGLTVGVRLWNPRCRAAPPKPPDRDPE
jgi:hypothetical protein